MSGKRTLKGRKARVAIRMMKRVARVLDKIKVPYILEAGTLLGVIRENRLLPWDNDVDFTITSDYQDILLDNIWRFKNKGYKVELSRFHRDLKYFKEGEPRILRIYHIKFYKRFIKKKKYDVMLEIFIKRKFGDEYYWTVGIKEPVLKSVPARFYENHTRYKFRCKYFSVPEDYIGYLEEHYGKDWRTPIKEWDFRTSDQSVKEFL